MMNSSGGENYSLQQSATTPAAVEPRESSGASHNEKVILMNSTPNGYSSSVSNHKIVPDDQSHLKKHHDSHNSSEHKHSDLSKYNSEHKEHKISSSSKHSSSSHSKSKDSINKISSHKSSESSKSKEHSSHEGEKKHHKEGGDHSEHLKHVKNDVDRLKGEDKQQKEKSASGKFSSDGVKKVEKPKDDKHKLKMKDGHSAEHKVHKDKSKELHDKHKDKSGEKVKDKSIKPKEKSEKSKDFDKPKDKSGEKLKDKSEKLKDKSGEKAKDKLNERQREKSGEFLKEKSVEKLKDEKNKDPSKVKKEGSVGKKEGSVVKKEREMSPSKKPLEMKNDSVSKKEQSESKPPAIVKIKEEMPSPVKYAEDSAAESDVPTESKSKKRSKGGDSDDDYAPSKAKAKKAKAEASKKRKRAEEADFEIEAKKPKKKVKKEKQDEGKEGKENETASPKKKGKKEDDQDVWKWWEEDKKEDGVKWNTLEHNGPVFAPPYERVPKNVKFYYDGKPMQLSELTEEVAGFYGRMLDHEYTTKEAFNNNFFKDWRKVMTPEEKEVIKDLKKCNFNDFNEYYKMKSEERKNMSREEKAEIKKQNEELAQKYGFCIVDGHRQKIGNFKIEPPGLFRGRGEHPKMGMLKRRVQPEDITINISQNAKVPEPPEGHRWKKVIHDNKVTWLASWNENILNSTKYIMLNPSSKLKGEKDWQKYETARKLKNYADQIRKTYTEDFRSKEMRVRQRAVALYFIDKLALRAGNEKDEDTADTVGCCSLRVEHITLHEEKDGQQYVVDFDFLGKDSIRYANSVPVDKRVFKNVRLFMENKQPGDDLFDRLNTTILNKYLNELMEGLTAKVFRTYNASKTLQEQLDLLTKEEMSVPEKLLAYNRANRAVAVLCNHQRSVPKTFSKSMEALRNKMDEKMKQIKDFKKELKQAKQDAKNGGAKEKVTYEKKKKRLKQLEEQLKKLEVQATDKEENKQIALGTSKLNYLDPRISVAWCKKWGVPVEKIYNRTQRDKFRWAIEMAGPDFRF